MGDERLKLGFIALDDAAPLIAAHALGYFADEGLSVALSREASWATVRDKVAFGALDGAHMLAPMALAAGRGGGEDATVPLVAPIALNLNGPAITLSARMAAVAGPGADARGLARLVARRLQEGASPITLAVVFPHSAHNYLLRDWLAAAGVDPDRDVRLIVAPPPRMAGLLAEGVIEGFSVTEPWDTAAVQSGTGVIAVRGSERWPRMPDKVFAMTTARASADPALAVALTRAMIRGAIWADEPANRAALAALLAEPAHLGADAGLIEASLGDIVFHAGGAGAPAPVHAAWLLAQMMRWGHAPAAIDAAATAAAVYRPDIYAAAAEGLGVEVPDPPAELEGYGATGRFTIADTAAEAARAPMSRIGGA